MSAVIEESDLVDLVKLSGLRRNVAGREPETLPEVGCPSPVDELTHDLTVVVIVELVKQNSVETTKVLHDSDHDVEEVFQVLSASKLVVHLIEN